MQKIIAVDFDGTIVENKYPEMGKPLMFVFDTLRALQAKDFLLILWTCRTGKLLDDAVELCRKNGVEFYAINANYPGEDMNNPDNPRKLTADIFIDDRNIGGLPSWGEIYHKLCPEGNPLPTPPKKKGLFSRIFG
ncbi:MAG: hydrolase [Bacteroidia bacterium]|nr:hydrolase [Bacteroidia bacterium]